MLNVELLRPVLRAAWGADTCDPHDLDQWRPDNPARGQCGVTALVVQDVFGGDLVLGDVRVGGRKVGHHYWNRLPNDFEVDLTADQFHPDEVVTVGEVFERPPGPPRRCRGQYELLRERVLSRLADLDVIDGTSVGESVAGQDASGSISDRSRQLCRAQHIRRLL